MILGFLFMLEIPLTCLQYAIDLSNLYLIFYYIEKKKNYVMYAMSPS